MIAYVDSSALAKLYVSERGTEGVGRIAAVHPLAASSVTYVEVRSALARRAREGELTREEVRHAAARLDAHWQVIAVVPSDDRLFRVAADLCDRRPLRAGDAIQLASALALRNQGAEVTFVCADRQLLAAAAAEGLGVLDPEA